MKSRLNPRPQRPKKSLPLETIEERQRQAVQFTQRFDPELAEELRELTPEQYAERRGISIQNSQREGVITLKKNPTSVETRADLEQERDEALDLLEEAQDSLDDLQDRIDDVLGDYDDEDNGARDGDDGDDE